MPDDFLTEMVQLAVESTLSEINTSTPGTIVSYDATRNRAVVRPVLPKRLADNTFLAPPNIVEVPVIWAASGGGKASMSFPLAPGDGVELHFQQRSMEGWLSGRNNAPDDPRQFDLSDCVAVPGLVSSGIIGDATDVVIKFNEAEFRIDSSNNIKFGNSNGSITITASGEIILNGTTINIRTPSNSYIMEAHRHAGIEPGSGISGAPIV